MAESDQDPYEAGVELSPSALASLTKTLIPELVAGVRASLDSSRSGVTLGGRSTATAGSTCNNTSRVAGWNPLVGNAAEFGGSGYASTGNSNAAVINSDAAGPSTTPSVSTVATGEDSIDPYLDPDERADLLSSSGSEDSDSESDSESPPQAKRAKRSISAETIDAWKRVTGKSLKNEKRKALVNKFPNPACDWAHTPKLDDAISCIIPKSAKTYDRYLSKLQQFSLDALGPILWLYDQRAKGLESGRGEEALAASISLIGNATAHISTERRKSVMKHLNKDLKPLCEGKFPDRGPYLFGEKFGTKAKETADNIKALKGIKPNTKRNQFFFWERRPKQRQGAPGSPVQLGQESGSASNLFTGSIAAEERPNPVQGQSEEAPPSEVRGVGTPPQLHTSRQPQYFYMDPRCYPATRGTSPGSLRAPTGAGVRLATTLSPSIGREDRSLLDSEVRSLLTKGAIAEVDNPAEGFFSTLFLVPKKDGRQSPVINLRSLNSFVRAHHFKMEGMHVVRDLLQQGDWLTRLDLKDAYFAIPVSRTHKKYLRFRWRKRAYQFRCLPFGLCAAPRTFTKVLRPVVGLLREMGIRCVVYLDDFLIMCQDKEEARRQTWLVSDLLEALGFLVNYRKSVTTPVQELTFLGFVINSLERKIRLPEEKVSGIRKEAKRLLAQHNVSARELAKFIGKLSAAILAVYPAPLHYRSLQALKHRVNRVAGYDGQMEITGPAREDLHWWISHLDEWNGREIQEMDPEWEIETDASLMEGVPTAEASSLGVAGRQRRGHYISMP